MEGTQSTGAVQPAELGRDCPVVAMYAEGRFKPYSEAERAERGDRPSLEWNQPLVWEVIDPRGQFPGRVTLPDKTSLAAARGTTVWGIQAGEYGEGHAVRFRVRTEREKP